MAIIELYTRLRITKKTIMIFLFSDLVKRLDMFRSILISSVGDVSKIRLEDTLKSQMRCTGKGFRCLWSTLLL